MDDDDKQVVVEEVMGISKAQSMHSNCQNFDKIAGGVQITADVI